MITLEGKIALVTGASRGIGQAIALKWQEMALLFLVQQLQSKVLAQSTLF